MSDKKKYIKMDAVLEKINKYYISLPEEEIARNNRIVGEFLGQLTAQMREIHPLFNEMCNQVFYGGSYYDGLRVAHPDEFDLDIVLTLPKLLDPILEKASPGFCRVRTTNLDRLRMSDIAGRYIGIDGLFRDNYLDNQCVLSWMERLLIITIQNRSSYFDIAGGTFQVCRICKSGPAFNITLICLTDNIKIDIDLVPCFEFTNPNQWSKATSRPNTTTKNRFLLVPKPCKDKNRQNWRLSFQEQERELLSGNYFLKPAIKLLKRMRDILRQEPIASYYIKTVALWEKENISEDGFWGTSLSYVFMTILKKYDEYLSRKYIPYYWDQNNNLLMYLKDDTIENFRNKIRKVINKIDKNLDNPNTVAEFLLTREELECFRIHNILNPQPEVLEAATQQQNSSCTIL